MHESENVAIKYPYVSIIIPTYNHARFLSEALTSVIQQSYDNWEAIVVDNYSTDNTIEVVNEFDDSRIKLVQINNHGVIAVSRNVGISMAKGEWVAFLDSDDAWNKDKLSESLEYNNIADFIFHDMDIVRSKKTYFKRKKLKGRSLAKSITRDLLVNGNPIANSSVLVKKDLLDRVGGIDESTKMKGCEDYNTWLKISRVSDKFTYIDKTLGCYREHENNFSANDMSLAQMAAIYEFKEIISRKEFSKAQSYVMYSKLRYSFVHKQMLITLSNVLDMMVCPKNEVRIKIIYMYLVSLMRRYTSNMTQ